VVSAAELEKLMEASIKDAREEPAFFRALLDATLYAHTPKIEPPGRRQFVMFKSPDDGQYVVPIFTDKAKADWAARGNVRVLVLRGRDLFDQTRGTALMLNPNDNRCTLYPEEIARLLRDGAIVTVQEWTVDGEDDHRVYKLDRAPKALVRGLRSALPAIRDVEVAYVAGLTWLKSTQPDSLLILLGGEEKVAERSVRTMSTILYDVFQRLNQSIDVLHFDSREAPPEWVDRFALKPVYRRRPMKPHPSSPGYN